MTQITAVLTMEHTTEGAAGLNPTLTAMVRREVVQQATLAHAGGLQYAGNALVWVRRKLPLDEGIGMPARHRGWPHYTRVRGWATALSEPGLVPANHPPQTN
jgi:hypothetical protein